MTPNERSLLRDLRVTADSHRKNGEGRTAALLDQAREKIIALLARLAVAHGRDTESEGCDER
jgi:hypothetical protein